MLCEIVTNVIYLSFRLQNFNKVEKILKTNNIFSENIGFVQKDYFEIEGEMKISIKDLFKINNQWYSNY